MGVNLGLEYSVAYSDFMHFYLASMRQYQRYKHKIQYNRYDGQYTAFHSVSNGNVCP